MNKQIQHIIDEIDTTRKTNNLYWNIFPETGIFLNTLVRARAATHILEVGTSIGYSTLYLADAAMATGGHIYTIESHAERFLLATETFTKAGVTSYITQIKGHAPEVFSTLTETIDLVFLDATKQEHVSYVEAIIPALSQNALIISDNILSHKKEMAPFLAYMHEQPAFQNVVIPLGTGLMLSIYTPSR